MLSLLASFLIAALPITITKKADCRTVAHRPAADVEYREGVDANGYAVAPADLTPPALSKEDFRRIEIPIQLPLKDYPAQKPDFAKTDAEWKQEQDAKKAAEGKKPETPTYNADLSQSWANAGSVAVDTKTGKVEMNGRDITPIDPAELNPDCNLE